VLLALQPKKPDLISLPLFMRMQLWLSPNSMPLFNAGMRSSEAIPHVLKKSSINISTRIGDLFCRHHHFRNILAVIQLCLLLVLKRLLPFLVTISRLRIQANWNSGSKAVHLHHSGMQPKKITGPVFMVEFTFIIRVLSVRNMEER